MNKMNCFNKRVNLTALKKVYRFKLLRWMSVTKSKTLNSRSDWASVVGLEIHAQILSKSKLFSGAKTEFGGPVNSCVALFDAAIPGTLPVLNKRCVEAGVLTALALSCNINAVSMFDRKHYFYADLPAGYQITQQRAPLANGGQLEFHVFTPGIHKKPYTKTARLIQLQLEQDSGKSLHDEFTKRSLVDLNRAGVPLMELVFSPDLSDGEEAAALVKELILILERLGTCSCKMEEGALRVDANISLHKVGTPLGIRSEVKNIGSVRGVAGAIAYEIERQRIILDSGGVITNETRAWDAVTKTTLPMRDKEETQDYRFMPEPNLPPLHLKMSESSHNSDDLVDVTSLKNIIPELPAETRTCLVNEFGLLQETAIILVNEPKLLDLFSKITSSAVSQKRTPKLVSNILVNELLALLNKKKIMIEECPVPADVIGELIDLVQSDQLGLVFAGKVLQDIIEGNSLSPTEIMTANKWSQITDQDELNKLCDDVILKNPKLVQIYKSGKKKLLFAIAGEVARNTNNRAKMANVVKILENKLKS